MLVRDDMTESYAIFDAAIRRWALARDGDAVVTRNSRLLPVRYDGVPAMLKIAIEAEEARGAAVMRWWGGEGAARVLASHGDALVLERAVGETSLVRMAIDGRDDEATRIVCGVAARLHARHDEPPSTVVPLTRWFAALWTAAASHGGLFTAAADVARRLLDTPREVVVLHGDLHHGNVLDFGAARGWLAIDPKGLLGERAFDFANLLCNPDPATAIAPGRFARQLDVVADAAAIDRTRMAQWALTYASLSAAWSIVDGDDPSNALRVADLAARRLTPA